MKENSEPIRYILSRRDVVHPFRSKILGMDGDLVYTITKDIEQIPANWEGTFSDLLNMDYLSRASRFMVCKILLNNPEYFPDSMSDGHTLRFILESILQSAESYLQQERNKEYSIDEVKSFYLWDAIEACKILFQNV